MHKFFSLLCLVICLVAFYPEISISNSTGSPGGKSGSPMDNSNCMSCHSATAISAGSITTNIPASGYVPGTVYTITANMNWGGGGFNLQGFEVTSEENTTNTKTGTFFITDGSATQLVNNGTAVTHTAGGNNLNTWSFDWEAPSSTAGDVTFYGAFIEAGYPQGNSGDYFSDYNLTVSPSCVDPLLIDSTITCQQNWDPVCGCDSVTYSNDCYAVNYGGVTSWTQGPCNPPSPCEVEISGDSIVCSFSNPQILTAIPTGGVQPYTYAWSNGWSNTSILTIINPGTYCVTITDANGCVATECITVSVEDIPISSAPSPSVICAGDSIVLEIDTTGLSNIVWMPLGAVNTVNRVVDYPISSTTYVVEAIDASGCDRRGEILVVVDSCNPPSPCEVEINNGTVDIEICDGDTAMLEATTGFDTYLWTEASAGTPLGSTHIINITDPGLYIVIATDIQNNCVDMDSIEVIVYPSTPLNPMTAPDPPMICLGDSVVIEVNSGFLNYWWNTGNPLDQDEDKVIVYPVQDFIYVVEALDSNGCESREEIEVFVDTCATGVMNIMSAQVIIYPNPAKGLMTITLPKSEKFDLLIYDIAGRVVLSENKISERYNIVENTLSNGSYLLHLKHDKGVIIKKIIFE